MHGRGPWSLTRNKKQGNASQSNMFETSHKRQHQKGSIMPKRHSLTIASYDRLGGSDWTRLGPVYQLFTSATVVLVSFSQVRKPRKCDVEAMSSTLGWLASILLLAARVGVINDDQAYTGIVVLISFLIVFRTQTGYQKPVPQTCAADLVNFRAHALCWGWFLHDASPETSMPAIRLSD